MDFVTDLAFAVLFALLKKPKIDAKLHPVLAKLAVVLQAAVDRDPALATAVAQKQAKS
jgi:hypothetical protein